MLFEKAFVTALDNNVSLKKKQLRHYHSPFMTKALRKAVKTHSKTYSTKSGLMKIGISIKTNKFLRYKTPWQKNRTTSIILMLKVSVVLKKNSKRLNLILATKD